jgi:hypothetical protein
MRPSGGKRYQCPLPGSLIDRSDLHPRNRQKQTALVVLSSLIAFTEKSLPVVSAWAMEMRGCALQVESDTNVPFLARL